MPHGKERQTEKIEIVMKRFMLLIAAAIASALGSVTAQQNLWRGEGLVSPEIANTGCVTFRLYAPEATRVEVAGDFLPQGVESAAMVRSEEGVWSYTTAPLASEM